MAEIKAKLSLNSSAFTAGLAKATASLRGMAGSVSSAAAAASTALAGIGAMAAGAFAVGIKSALDYAGNISDVAARTGIASGQLAILQQAFKDAGLGAEQAGPTINKMQRALFEAANGSKEAKDALAQLGLSVDDLLKLSPSEQFEAITAALRGVNDEAASSALAMRIFGRSGAELKALIKDTEAFSKARQRIGGQADILDRSGGRMDAVSDSFGAIATKVRGLFLGAAEALLPALERLAAFIDSIDLTGFGQRLGAAINSAINILTNAFAQGKLGELVGLSLKIAFGAAANYLGGVLLGVIDALGAGFSAVMQAVFSGETLKPAFQVFLAIPEIIIGGLIALMGRVAAALQGALVFAIQGMVNVLPPRLRKWLTGSEAKGTMTLSDAIADSNQGIAGSVAGVGEKLVADAIARFVAAGKVAADIGATAGAAMLEELKKISSIDLINTDKWREQLAVLAAQLNIPAEKLAEASKQMATGGGAMAIGKTSDKIEQSGFAKIGLFAGGAAASGVEYARKTSEATMTLVQMVKAGIRVNAMDVKVTAFAG